MSGRQPSQAELQPLIDLGFTRSHAVAGLQRNSFNLNQAINWCLSNSPAAPAPTSPSRGALETLVGMGFSESHCRTGLMLNNNNLDQALQWVLSNQDQGKKPEAKAPKAGGDDDWDLGEDVVDAGAGWSDEDDDDNIRDPPAGGSAGPVRSTVSISAGSRSRTQMKTAQQTKERLAAMQLEAEEKAKAAEKARNQKIRKAQAARRRREAAIAESLRAAADRDAQTRDARENELTRQGLHAVLKKLVAANGVVRARETGGVAIRILANLMRNPRETRYRRLRMGGSKLQRLFVRTVGGMALLRCIGFVKDNDDEDDDDDILVFKGRLVKSRLKRAAEDINRMAVAGTRTCIPQAFEAARKREADRGRPGAVERVLYCAVELRKLFANVLAGALEDHKGRTSRDFRLIDMNSQIFRLRLRPVPVSLEVLKRMGYLQKRDCWVVEQPNLLNFEAAVADLGLEISKMRPQNPVHRAVARLVRANPDVAARRVVGLLSACLSRIVQDPNNEKYHKLKMAVLFRKTGPLDGGKDLVRRVGFVVDDLTDTAKLRVIPRTGEVDASLVGLRKEAMEGGLKSALSSA